MNDMKDLVGMANQIASFFAAYPEDEAVAGIADHIRDFWTPDMQRNLEEHSAAGGDGLSPLAFRAMRRNDSQVVKT